MSADPLRGLVLGTLMPGFAGTTVPAWIDRAYAAGLASVCLYGENMAGDDALSALCTDLRRGRPDVLICVDEEGGDVTRLHYLTGSGEPGNAVLGRLDDTRLTRASAVRIGRDLAAYGINLNLAPVVDVNSAPDNPVIGVRSFGADPALVGTHSAAWVSGLQEVGVAACAKHFPGHGDTVADSHLALPTVEVSPEVLRARELVPFRAVVEAGVATIMTSHVLVPSVDPDAPATFSEPLLQGILRGELGFTGVIVSDALDMAGASKDIGIPEAAVRALAAGVDLLCLGPATGEDLLTEVVDTVVAAVGSGRLPRARVEDAAARVAALAEAHPAVLPDPDGARGAEVITDAFEVSPAARDWIADAATPVIVQVESAANLAVGEVAWGPAAVGATVAVEEVPAGTKVAVLGRGLTPTHPVWDLADELRRAGHRVIVVESGWPRGGADLVTYGGSRAVGRALAGLLGVPSVDVA